MAPPASQEGDIEEGEDTVGNVLRLRDAARDASVEISESSERGFTCQESASEVMESFAMPVERNLSPQEGP